YGAIGIGYDESTVLSPPGLAFEELDVIVVDLRDHQRHVRLHAQGAGIGDYAVAGVWRKRAQVRRDPRNEGGQNRFWDISARRPSRRTLHPGYTRGDRCAQTPMHSLRVGLALRPVGGRQPGHLEPWMVLQHLHKALSDDPGRAQNSYRNFRLHGLSWILHQLSA